MVIYTNETKLITGILAWCRVCIHFINRVNCRNCL